MLTKEEKIDIECSLENMILNFVNQITGKQDFLTNLSTQTVEQRNKEFFELVIKKIITDYLYRTCWVASIRNGGDTAEEIYDYAKSIISNVISKFC